MEDANAHLERAKTLLWLMRPMQARLDADAAARLDPSPAVLHFRARLALFNSDIMHAQQDLDQALRLAPNDPHILVPKGYALLQLNQLNDAISTIDRALANPQVQSPIG